MPLFFFDTLFVDKLSKADLPMYPLYIHIQNLMEELLFQTLLQLKNHMTKTIFSACQHL